MPPLGRTLGLLRSLAVYHGIPLRQRRLKQLYAAFVERGDLAFDIGAHVGNRTRAMAALGCRVVALEPQPDVARLLRAFFGRRREVEILEAAVGEHCGHARLLVSDKTPTMTTLTSQWREAREQDPVFAGVAWNRELEVTTTTLDALITRFGVPRFIKIDVEGGEPEALSGLTQAIQAISFEYLPDALDYTKACVTRLAALGPYDFNWSPGESYRLESEQWLTGKALLQALGTPAVRRRSGDVYARLSRLDPAT
ncbi:MAG: FkbM family methyltransferase [Acidobacteria bacterium]|nr:FkbM family methyltransferase [Acidobacteriota bacterium]